MTLANRIAEVAKARPRSEALVYWRYGIREALTFAELESQIRKAEHGFAKLGVHREETIAILPALTPESVLAIIAAASVGIAHPINLLLSADALKAQLLAVDAKVLVTIGVHPALDLPDLIAGMAHRPEHVIETPLTDGQPRFTPWEKFLGAYSELATPAIWTARQSFLFATGGATSAPKIARLNELSVLSAATNSAHRTGIDETSRVLASLPLFHVAGLITTVIGPLLSGAAVVLQAPFGAREPGAIENTWSLVERERISIVSSVATTLTSLAKVPVDGRDLSSLSVIVSGASPVSVGVAQAVQTATGTPVTQMYGMTETAGTITMDDPQDHVLGSVGKPIKGMEIRIRGGMTTGEIETRGENLFSGYLTGDSDQSAFTDDGWLKTGDLGRIGAEGELYITGRAKDLIIRSGHNIDPIGIEDVALAHPAIALAAAIGMPDDYAGELPVVYVELIAGACHSADELCKWIADRVIEPPARPKRLFILDKLPMTAVGKVFKPELRKTAADWVEINSTS
jgi:fatty-acyl-CoA synthase